MKPIGKILKDIKSDHVLMQSGMQRIAVGLSVGGKELLVIASWDAGWDHVSVRLKDRCPIWMEMCYVKDLFWQEQECVVQFHPPKADYINRHPFVLHLWKPQGEKLLMPPPRLV